MKPVVVDHGGLIRLSSILTSVEERLLSSVTGCAHTITQLSQIHIPNHNSWIVTMWHFGTRFFKRVRRREIRDDMGERRTLITSYLLKGHERWN